jgi:hypothetical protein
MSRQQFLWTSGILLAIKGDTVRGFSPWISVACYVCAIVSVALSLTSAKRSS